MLNRNTIGGGNHVSKAEGGKSLLLISTMVSPLLSLSPNSISFITSFKDFLNPSPLFEKSK